MRPVQRSATTTVLARLADHPSVRLGPPPTAKDIPDPVARRAALKSPEGRVLRPLGRHDDHRRVRVVVAHVLDEFKPVHLGHEQVGEHQGRGVVFEELHGLHAVDGRVGVVAAGFSNQIGDDQPKHRRIVHDEHARQVL